MNRRELLAALGVGVLGALAACAPAPESPIVPARPGPRIVPTATVVDRVPSPGVALTVDDGVSTAVVAAYAEVVRATGLRLTFFATGIHDSWRANAPALRPLVESGQVQIGNHTWSHPDITRIPDTQLVAELTRNEAELHALYGISTRPFFRPPWMSHDARTDRISREEGYPILPHWSGSLGDEVRGISGADVLRHARAQVAAGAILLGHANEPAVSGVLDQIAQLIADRALVPVTLADVYTAA